MKNSMTDTNCHIQEFIKLFPEKTDQLTKITELAEKKVQAHDIGIILSGGDGQIPVLYAKGKCLPEAWENSLIALFSYGTMLETQYDK